MRPIVDSEQPLKYQQFMRFNWKFIAQVGVGRWVWRSAVRRLSGEAGFGNTVTLPTGLRLWLPPKSKFGSEVFITNCDVDWGSERLFVGSLDRMKAVLDIGANIGYYSLYVLPKVGAVHSFEPDPRAHTHLVVNLSEYRNAFVHAVAVGSVDGMAKFHLDYTPETSHLSEDGISIEVVTVDRFVKDRNLHITGIKIDVEGHDLDVIEGSRLTLASQAPLVLTEAKPEARLFKMLEPTGYRVFAFIRDKPRDSRLVEIVSSSTHYDTKMLFLVLDPLYSRFSQVAGRKTSQPRI